VKDHTADKELRSSSFVIKALSVFILLVLLWSTVFEIDQTARATGQVIATSRVQIIQAANGGVLDQVYVQKGDRVDLGQKLASLEKTSFEASVNELRAKVANLEAVASRLRAELLGDKKIAFTKLSVSYPDVVNLQEGLFKQREKARLAEIKNLKTAYELAAEEAGLVKKLMSNGDINRTELIRVKKAENEAESNLINRQNRILEELNTELVKVEDEIRQNREVLIQRTDQLENSEFHSRVRGIVKDVKATTSGAVLRTGEEIMQIVPTDDELILEVKVEPADIASIQKGLKASIRFDAFDYSIYGVGHGLVSYVSADTLIEDAGNTKKTYYQVNVTLDSNPVVTNNAKTLDIIPGMTATVDLHTGKRNVLNYLLKPLRKTLDNAFTER